MICQQINLFSYDNKIDKQSCNPHVDIHSKIDANSDFVPDDSENNMNIVKDETILTNIRVEQGRNSTSNNPTLNSWTFQDEMKDVLILFRLCPSKNEYIKVILMNGKIVGAMIIGDTDLEETMESLIISNTDLSFLSTSLLDPEIDLEDYFD